MQKIALLLSLLMVSASLSAQYRFASVAEVGCTAVKNQERTGTCWSFSTCSFLESELMRLGKGQFDLSEMYVVKNIYLEKGQNYVLRQGKANFGEGGLNHDFVRTVARHGIVPEEVYSGKLDPSKPFDHSEMVAALEGMLEKLTKRRSLSPNWKVAYEAVLDAYMGDWPEEFSYRGKTYTPLSFAQSLGLNPDDYVSLTSFSHHPFYGKFVLEIPDNFSNESYFNLPLDELQAIVDYAIAQGYTIAWDGDVSEKNFSPKEGIALLPADPSREDRYDQPGKEIAVDQNNRQAEFESYATTDDHLMHIVGIVKDQAGTKYYKIKNSWGKIGDLEGFLYMSEAYFRMKTVGIMVHKSAIPRDIAGKIEL